MVKSVNTQGLSPCALYGLESSNLSGGTRGNNDCRKNDPDFNWPSDDEVRPLIVLFKNFMWEVYFKGKSCDPYLLGSWQFNRIPFNVVGNIHDN